MNGSFAVYGLLVVAGAVLTRRAWPATRPATAGLSLLALAGWRRRSCCRPASISGSAPGGMERVAANPLTLWLLVAGLWLLRRRYAAGKPTALAASASK
ncbi:hypothetical protein AB0K40_33800 [Nonomuraea bangladeshensis]|uniref:Uncharacterized protein n=1 Tax=Nonomuraea bangladeshensis TaxID=404385 RepID=A0ABV3HDC7_9ACTN